MGIAENGSGVIVYSEPPNKRRSDETGTVVDQEFAIIDKTNVLKQIQFQINPTTDAPGVVTIQADIAGDATINLSAVGAKSNSFAIIQPDLGTSPTASSYTDTLTLTSSDNSVAITGDSVTKTINFQAGASSPMTTLGDIIYENATPAPDRLPGNTSTTKNFLTQTGTGAVSAPPSWGTIAAADVTNGMSLVSDNVPGTNNTYDLGSSTTKWKDGWFYGTVFCGGLTTGSITAAILTAASGASYFYTSGNRYLEIDLSGSSINADTVLKTTSSASRNISLPDLTSTLIGYTAAVAGTTKTTPSAVDQWLTTSLSGTTYYIPLYTSTTT